METGRGIVAIGGMLQVRDTYDGISCTRSGAPVHVAVDVRVAVTGSLVPPRIRLQSTAATRRCRSFGIGQWRAWYLSGILPIHVVAVNRSGEARPIVDDFHTIGIRDSLLMDAPAFTFEEERAVSNRDVHGHRSQSGETAQHSHPSGHQWPSHPARGAGSKSYAIYSAPSC